MPGPILRHYRELISDGGFIADAAQHAAARVLDELARDLCARRTTPGVLGRLRRSRHAPVRGLYLWGGVGRGKTWLMDLFHDGLPLERKERVHFHRFMRKVHDALRTTGQARDPLLRVADAWSRRCDVLCLDEFFVSDIADAMLLAGLLERLFENGTTLVTTSNIAPDGLYRDGLQRAKFLPAIESIKRNMQVMRLDGDADFRLRILERSEIFHAPLGDDAERGLATAFARIAAEAGMDPVLDINGRAFHARRRGDGVVWFEFEELCGKPRGAIDYIELARAFNTVLLGNVPQLGEADADAARRFITLVDEFYDRNVKLLMSAAVPVNELYRGRRLAFEFERTASRLTEMQSHAYLARPHLP
ncbi:MAG: cell division protein ZapE [Xanthomonadales bacterium]